MMVKLVHTADWQLGLKALHAGEKAKDVRARRIVAAERVADLAQKEQADFLILAGDTFEHHDVDDLTIKRTVDVLSRLAIPVFVLPGNHDPLVPGGVWDRPCWRQAGPHVRLLSLPREVDLGNGVALYPCPLRQKRSSLDPTEWIPPRAEGDARVRIGIAHGALDLLPEKANFPIARDRAETRGLDYLALGDWHGHLVHGRAAYSGTHEPTTWSEKDPGQALVVTIDAAGALPRLTRHEVATLRWVELDTTIQDPTDVDALEARIKAAAPLNVRALRVRVRVQASELLPRLATLEQLAREDAFLVDWQQDEIAGSSSPSGVSLPSGVLDLVDESLRTILDGRIPEGPGKDFASHPRDIVVSARHLLHRVARGEDA